FQSPVVRVSFSEPVDAASAQPSRFTLEGGTVERVDLSPSRREAMLRLAKAPEVEKPYVLYVEGIKDGAGNPMRPATLTFAVQGPVFSLDGVTPEQRGKPIPVPGLPVRARDAWTINCWVKTGAQPA